MSWLSRRFAIVVAGMLVVSSCAEEERVVVYRAEKMLYGADKMKAAVMATMIPSRSEFLDPTISAYRDVVARFAGRTDDAKGIENVVLTAQLSIARLELDTDRVAQARRDFLAVLDIRGVLPEARMDALFSAAKISKQMREPERAFELYEQFYGDYLSLEKASATVSRQPEYLETPLELARLSRRIGRKDEEVLWLQTAETLYEYIIDTEPEAAVLEATRFKLLDALVGLKKSDRALELSRTLTNLYRDDASRTALLLLEARVHEVGKRDPHAAEDLYRHIYEQYPTSADAPSAMLAHAALRASQRDTTAARQLYERVVSTYKGRPDIAARAKWQVALMAEASGNWVDASLRYKAIARQYPGTDAAFDAPMRLASGYLRLGAQDAADSAYERALEDYRKIAQGRYPVVTRLVAEERVLEVLTMERRWEDAVRHLVDVARRYAAFERTQQNYITAADICGNELGDEQRADHLLADCIEKFPGTDAARKAQAELGLRR